MTATGHAVIGAVIAAKIGNPFLAVPIAIASHIAADAFPHWDTGTHKSTKPKMVFFVQSLFDLGMSYIAGYFIANFLNPGIHFLYVFLIVTAAQLLDWISAPYNFLNMKFPPFSTVYWFQKLFDNKLDKPWGVIGQVAVLFFLVVFAKAI